jgi:HAD superfamily hydrolase (TIGR01484 family)
MKPIAQCPIESLKSVKYVLCDIDDTLTWQGTLPAVAYSAMERLQNAGLIVAPITGRPGGWCDHIARMWPVDGVVGENGAFYFHYDKQNKRMRQRYWRSDEQRKIDRNKLNGLAGAILKAVPGAGIASDQAYREADLAIDFCEDVEALRKEDIHKIVQLFEAEGAVAKVSSIHVNGWFGDYDKLTMCRRFLDEIFGFNVDDHREACVFVGDSPNDAPMFEYFPFSVGVANIREFSGSLDAEPGWITSQPGGFGFAEFADILLAEIS